MNTLPEWTDLRFFLELARAGTLSGASRRLEVEHTTVARRIDRLEVQLIGGRTDDGATAGSEALNVATVAPVVVSTMVIAPKLG